MWILVGVDNSQGFYPTYSGKILRRFNNLDDLPEAEIEVKKFLGKKAKETIEMNTRELLEVKGHQVKVRSIEESLEKFRKRFLNYDYEKHPFYLSFEKGNVASSVGYTFDNDILFSGLTCYNEFWFLPEDDYKDYIYNEIYGE